MASALTSASFGAFSMPSQSVLRLLALRNAWSASSSDLRSTCVLALARDEIVGERHGRDAALAIGGRDVQLLLDAEARDAGELEQIAAVAALGELGDAADAADLEQERLVLGAGMRRVRLDHADQPMAVAHRVVDHREIARLENVERQSARAATAARPAAETPG